eukprot:40753-Pelagomonas_calceolata.AAC.1
MSSWKSISNVLTPLRADGGAAHEQLEEPSTSLRLCAQLEEQLMIDAFMEGMEQERPYCRRGTLWLHFGTAPSLRQLVTADEVHGMGHPFVHCHAPVSARAVMYCCSEQEACCQQEVSEVSRGTSAASKRFQRFQGELVLQARGCRCV